MCTIKCSFVTTINFVVSSLAAPRIYSANSQFGDGTRPFAYAISRCFGWEKSISECVHVRERHVSCSRSQAAGVACRDGKFNINLYCCQHLKNIYNASLLNWKQEGISFVYPIPLASFPFLILSPQVVLMTLFVWLEVTVRQRELWRCALIRHGG